MGTRIPPLVEYAVERNGHQGFVGIAGQRAILPQSGKGRLAGNSSLIL